MRIRLDEDVVIAEGEGYIDGDDLHAGMNAGLELLASKQLTKWLADMRFRRATPEADVVWIAKDWTPRAIAAGLRWLAIVVPTSVLGLMSMRSITKQAGELSIETKYFDTLEGARAWLASQK